MDRHGEHWSVGHDLALIYIAMAHGTDNRLSDEEIASITDRVRAWLPDRDKQAVQEVVLEAMSVYLDGSRDEELRGSLVAVRKDFPETMRAAVIEDLMQVAMADDVFLHEEGGFIGLLSKVWDVHPGQLPPADEANGSEPAGGV